MTTLNSRPEAGTEKTESTPSNVPYIIDGHLAGSPWDQLENAVCRALALLEMNSNMVQNHKENANRFTEEDAIRDRNAGFGVWLLNDMASRNLWQAYKACWEEHKNQRRQMAA